MTKQYINPPDLYVSNAYSHAVRAGNTIYLAGMVGVDLEGNLVGDGSISAQVHGAYRSVKSALKDAGATLDDLVSTRVYLTKHEDIEPYKEAREQYLTRPGPGMTLLIVKALGRADLLFELEAIAVVA